MDTEQCNGCYHWRSVCGSGRKKCCNGLTDIGRRKTMEGGLCLSRETGVPNFLMCPICGLVVNKEAAEEYAAEVGDG